MSIWETEFSDEYEYEHEDELAGQQWEEGETDGEESELELAQELLEVQSEEELEEFLGKLVKGAGKFLKSKVGRTVTGVLRNVAKTALPVVGSAIGSFVAPGLGTAIGGKLGSMAGSLLEAEEAELLGEEAELEAARRFVRFGRATVRYAAQAPRSAPPRAVARSAAITAARRHAPALLRSGTSLRRGRPVRGRSQRSPRLRAQRRLRWQWGSSAWPPPWAAYVPEQVPPVSGSWSQPDDAWGADDGTSVGLGGPGDGGGDGDWAGADDDDWAGDDESGFEFE